MRNVLKSKAVWAALVVVAGTAGVVALVDPFGGAGAAGSGVVDNSSSTSTTTIARETISSTTDVSATLGYSGTYNLDIPNGTPSASVAQAEAAAQSAEQRVQADQAALSLAVSMENSQGAANILAATSTLTADQAELAKAQAVLTTDEETGCPAASSSNVTSPIGGSSAPGGSSSPGSSSSPDGSTGQTGSPSKATSEPGGRATSSPQVSALSASASSTSVATLTARIDPEGLPTTYYFEWGTTLAFGSRTPVEDAGSSFGAVPVSAQVSGLGAGSTYLYELVATNSKGTYVTSPSSFTTVASSCSEESQTVTADQTAVTEARDTLAADEANASSSVVSDASQLADDEASAASAEQELAQVRSTETNPHTTYTYLPAAGTVLSRGSTAYALDGVKVPLFYGDVTPWRALYAGVTDGPDVAQLNANLVALGFGHGQLQPGPHFSAATTAAVQAWQRSTGAAVTGSVALGDYVVELGPVLVGAVTASLGSTAQPGQSVLSGTSTTPVVTIALDPSEQSYVHVGDPVSVTLPDNSSTPGHVSSVGKVATSSPSGSSGQGGNGNSGNSGPTIAVQVTLDHPGAAGGLDQASVNVAITVATVPNALVVPVDALLALSGGGYAVEEVAVGGAHSLVAVNLGLFDDADGLVQVSGAGLAAGQRIVVPQL